MTLTRVWVGTVLVSACACAFDSSAAGADVAGDVLGGTSTSMGSATLDPTSGVAMSGGEGSSGAEVTSSASVSGGTSTTGMVTTSGVDTDALTGGSTATTATTGGDTTTGGGSSSTGPSCQDGEVQTHLVWAEAAVIDMMTLEPSTMLPDHPCYAHSEVADTGTARFEFISECGGTYRFWGLVWDARAGVTNGGDPDSFYLSIDDNPTLTTSTQFWPYGCDTGPFADGTWSWLPLELRTAQTCAANITVSEILGPGVHEVGLRNREAGETNSHAGVAALVASTDPDFDPTTLYDPAGADGQVTPNCN